MKTILWKAVIISTLLIAVADISAAAQAKESGSQPPPADDHPGIILRGSDVINAKVFSQNGEELGHIRDVLLDPKTGNISYAVIGMGGWQGIRETYSIVPWQKIKQDEQRAENYIIQADQETVKAAPSFERSQWATVIQPDYLAKIQNYYASAASRSQSQAKPLAAKAPASPTPAPTATPAPTSATPTPAVAATQKAPPSPTPVRQAKARPRKEQQDQQKQRQSSKRHSKERHSKVEEDCGK